MPVYNTGRLKKNHYSVIFFLGCGGEGKGRHVSDGAALHSILVWFGLCLERPGVFSKKSF